MKRDRGIYRAEKQYDVPEVDLLTFLFGEYGLLLVEWD